MIRLGVRENVRRQLARFDEFQELMFDLLGVTDRNDYPLDRLKVFWQGIDEDGSGAVPLTAAAHRRQPFGCPMGLGQICMILPTFGRLVLGRCLQTILGYTFLAIQVIKHFKNLNVVFFFNKFVFDHILATKS